MDLLNRFPLLSARKPVAYSLLDIGRDTVKAAVVIAEGEVVQLVGWGCAATGSHDIAGGRLAAAAVHGPVDAALTQAEDQADQVFGQKVVPDHLIMALPGRATFGRIFTVRESRPHPKTPITNREVNSLRRRVEKLVRQEFLKSLPDGTRKWRPMAVSDAGLWLDQQRVTEAIGLSGQDVVYSVFGVAGQSQALKALLAVAERLNLDVTNIVAAPQALAALVPQTEAVILDVGDSGTEIGLIQADALVGTDYVLFGGHFFTQALAQGLKIEPEQALSLKQRLASQDLDRAERIRAETVLGEPRRRWHGAVLDSLKRLSPEGPLPRRIYLTGGSSLLPGLDKLLRTEVKWFDGAVEVEPWPHVSGLGVKDLTGSLDLNRFALTVGLTVGLPG